MADQSNVGKLLLEGIAELKHRGPNAWGVSIVDSKGKTRFFGDHHAFPKIYETGNFKGSMGVAHARYITTANKDDLIRDAQPLLHKETGFAISFNGHLQTDGLREALEAKGIPFKTNNDGELILNFLVHEISRKWNFHDAVEDFRMFEEILKPAIAGLMNELRGRGAYSVIGLLGDSGLFAFRDPLGFRPLTYAAKSRKGGFQLFASETTVLKNFGEFETVRQIEPGELIFVSRELNVFDSRLTRACSAFCALEPVYLAAADSILGGKKVEELRRRLGNELAIAFQALKPQIDVITPVPETAVPAAAELALIWEKPLGGIIKTAPVRSFLEPNPTCRENAARQKYGYLNSFIKNKRLALIDDTIIRGTTMTSVITNLRRRGAAEIHVFVTFPPIAHPCFYGIDIPSKSDLIVHRMKSDLHLLSREINADSVNFLDETKVGNALKALGSLCLACANGNYQGGVPEAFSKKVLTKSIPQINHNKELANSFPLTPL
ncbi:hypothetical protein H6S82_00455 [Planktothrix sp. FACHB-1355]|uniref:amidophosphoribosyltransferase n=1 Tax=Planktothrix sp. FACHB-1355 TaxID=2692854 RepID=UPI00168C002C|nr:hypothetical protein [Planktothrix sp. FACHB-1355]MBD3557340.1 hypothetical protein [Planktothrix sp. FACHB-1355]